MRARVGMGDVFPESVTVELSRKNIESLLYMLDKKDKQVPALSSRDNDIEILVLPVEEHSDGRPAGKMSWES
jgi:hypothetical protein